MTLVNIITVTPARQAEVAELLIRATDETRQHIPEIRPISHDG